MNDRSTLLLEHHLKELKLPSFLREYGKMAAQCAAEGVDHPGYLLRLAKLELIDRHQRMVERRIRAARFPAVKSMDTFDFTAIPSVNKALVMELARCEYVQRRENVIGALTRIHRWTARGQRKGGKGVTGAMIRARIRVDGRLAGGLQALLGAPMAACSGCGERDGGIGHGKRRSRTGIARVGGDVQLAGWRVSGRRAPSGWEWNGSQSGQGAAELLPHGQRSGRCRVNRRAERVSRPAIEKKRRRRVLVVTICSPRPMRAVQRARLWAITRTASQAPLAAKRPEGMWFSPTPYLRSRIAFSISAWRR